MEKEQKLKSKTMKERKIENNQRKPETNNQKKIVFIYGTISAKEKKNNNFVSGKR